MKMRSDICFLQQSNLATFVIIPFLCSLVTASSKFPRLQQHVSQNPEDEKSDQPTDHAPMVAAARTGDPEILLRVFCVSVSIGSTGRYRENRTDRGLSPTESLFLERDCMLPWSGPETELLQLLRSTRAVGTAAKLSDQKEWAFLFPLSCPIPKPGPLEYVIAAGT